MKMRHLGFVCTYMVWGRVPGMADVTYRDQALLLHGNVARAKGLSFPTLPLDGNRNSFSQRKHQVHHTIIAFFSQKNKITEATLKDSKVSKTILVQTLFYEK